MARPRTRSQRSPRSPQRLILDSGAVIALARLDMRARAYLARARELGVEVEIPVVVLAETLRGGPSDAAVHRVVNAVGETPPTTDPMGRRAGSFLAAFPNPGVADALVVAQAVERGASLILTSDPGDLARLAADHPDVVVAAV
ncbi:MAG: PIN domain-containing protein [Acidimicrobiia bacterium]